MTAAERLEKTLDFEKMEEGGAFCETFFPWTLTVERWREEGLNQKFTTEYLYPEAEKQSRKYFNDLMAEPVYEYEQELGLDGVKRMSFRIPFKSFEEQILEDTESYTVKKDEDGWIRKYYKERELVENIKPVVSDCNDWEILKRQANRELEQWCTDEEMQLIYGKYVKDHKEGKFSIRFRASGFFWTARELMGVEEHLLAFYEMPELLHEINDFILEIYMKYFDKIFDLIKPEVLLFEEDLSGADGPMISPAMFDEFVGAYYKKLVPFLKSKGVGNIFVDTDGDFSRIIPNFVEAGVDGFLPMDVNAGMDIVEVRRQFPGLKFIGGFNKLAISKGKEEIDREFERILPVIRQGGYIPGADHQVAPSASFENYMYYLKQLKKYMKEAGADIVEHMDI